MNAPPPAHQDVQTVLQGEAGDDAAAAAQRLGAFLQHDVRATADPAMAALLEQLVEHEESLICSLINLLSEDPVLSHKDDYAVMLTALRFAAPNAHRANMTIMHYCQPLFPVIKHTFHVDPDGYTCPELVSMLGSITTDEGPASCLPYLYPMLELLPAILSHVGVVTVVAALLWVNLTKEEPLMSAARPEEAAPEEAAAAQRAPPPPPQQQQQPPRQRAAPPPLPRLAVVSGIPAAGSSALLGAANVARTPPLHRFAAAAAQPHEPQQRAYAHHQQLQQTPSAAAEAALSAVPMTNAQLDAVHGLIFGALHAAFQGSQYMERRWGPLPTCLALSQLCSVSARSRQLIWQRQRVPSIAWVLAHPRQDMWPVRNFPAGYFERAFASALSCLMSLAQDGHLLGAVPSLLNLITNMLEIHSTSTPICRAALGLADTVVRQEQARALQALSPSALAERRRCVAVLRVDHGSHAFERPLFEALHNHGWQHRMVGRRRRGRLLRLMSSAEADIAEDMEACSLLLVLSRPRRWNHSRQNLNFPLHYACFLKMPILVVNDNNGGHGGSTGSSGSVASSGSGGSSGSINVTVGDAAAGAAVLSANGAVPLAAAANATPSQTEGLSVAVEALLQGLAPLTSRPVMMISATPDADGAGRVVEEMRRAVYGDREAEAAADEAMAMMKRAAQLRRKSRKAAAGAEEEDEDEDDAACGALTRATAELVL